MYRYTGKIGQHGSRIITKAIELIEVSVKHIEINRATNAIQSSFVSVLPEFPVSPGCGGRFPSAIARNPQGVFIKMGCWSPGPAPRPA